MEAKSCTLMEPEWDCSVRHAVVCRVIAADTTPSPGKGTATVAVNVPEKQFPIFALVRTVSFLSFRRHFKERSGEKCWLLQGTDYFFELALDLRLLVVFQITSSIPTAKTNALKVNATTKRKSKVLFLPTPTTPPSRAARFKSETVGCVKENWVVFLFFFFFANRDWHSVCGPNACLFRHCWRPNPQKQLFKT